MEIADRKPPPKWWVQAEIQPSVGSLGLAWLGWLAGWLAKLSYSCECAVSRLTVQPCCKSAGLFDAPKSGPRAAECMRITVKWMRSRLGNKQRLRDIEVSGLPIAERGSAPDYFGTVAHARPVLSGQDTGGRRETRKN